MLDLLLQRSTVIAFAVIGGIFSLAAMWLGAGGRCSEVTLKRLNKIAYLCMAVSVVLFVVAGLLQK